VEAGAASPSIKTSNLSGTGTERSERGIYASRYVVVDTRNWLPGRHVVIPPQWIKDVDWNERVVNVDVTQLSKRCAGSPTTTCFGDGLKHLGLVCGLVELRGGRVTVVIAGPGHGSEFTVPLPRPAELPWARHQRW